MKKMYFFYGSHLNEALRLNPVHGNPKLSEVALTRQCPALKGSVARDTRFENAQRSSAVTPPSGCFMLLQKRLENTIPSSQIHKSKSLGRCASPCLDSQINLSFPRSKGGGEWLWPPAWAEEERGKASEECPKHSDNQGAWAIFLSFPSPFPLLSLPRGQWHSQLQACHRHSALSILRQAPSLKCEPTRDQLLNK